MWIRKSVDRFLAHDRQHIAYTCIRALYTIARPFVRQSVLCVTRVNHTKRLKLGLSNVHHTAAPLL